MRNPGGANHHYDNHGELMDEYGDLMVGARVQIVGAGNTTFGTVWPIPKNYYLSSVMPLIPIRIDGFRQELRQYNREHLRLLD